MKFKLQLFFLSPLIALIILSYPAKGLADLPDKSLNQEIKLNVIASIKPIQLLAQSVVGDLSQVGLLIDPHLDAHQYRLKISDLKKINQADVVFFTHPELERFIAKLLQSGAINYAYQLLNASDSEKYLSHLAIESEIESASERQKTSYLSNALEQLKRIEAYQHPNKKDRAVTNQYPNEYASESQDDHKDDHQNYHSDEYENEYHPVKEQQNEIVLDHSHSGYLDPHIWLDPLYAIAMLDMINKQLSKIYPSQQDQFNHNTSIAKDEIKQSIAQAKRILNPVSHTPYLVFHDAFRYFSAFFNLNRVDAISDEHHNISVTKITHLREKINQFNIQCIFSQNQFVRAQRAIDTIIQKQDVKIVNLDPMASEFNNYADYFSHLAKQFESCLRE